MAGKVEEIKNEINQMSVDQLKEFRAWYEEFDSSVRDAQIEEDAQIGKLDDLASKALLDHKAGNTNRL
ncbi:hypothetical protein AB833_03705 [Chromatiales bacterium (ex Bugula neritina AB1)]|nr:hypothetical protein AB833_03705 [Chromatiales bacterium (ex Bugula neritina AB1)]